jgi:gas vesicle protein
MEEFLRGAMIGALVGAGVAAVVVSKNKKLSQKIKKGVNDIQEKWEDAKESMSEKFEECDCLDADEMSDFCGENEKNRSQNKKYKN